MNTNNMKIINEIIMDDQYDHCLSKFKCYLLDYLVSINDNTIYLYDKYYTIFALT